VETYPCPHCGGDTITGGRCQACERKYDPELAKLAMFQRWVAALESKKQRLVNDQLVLRTQLAHASAQRDALAREIRQRRQPNAPRRVARTLLPKVRRAGRDGGGADGGEPRSSAGLAGDQHAPAPRGAEPGTASTAGSGPAADRSTRQRRLRMRRATVLPGLPDIPAAPTPAATPTGATAGPTAGTAPTAAGPTAETAPMATAGPTTTGGPAAGMAAPAPAGEGGRTGLAPQPTDVAPTPRPRSTTRPGTVLRTSRSLPRNRPRLPRPRTAGRLAGAETTTRTSQAVLLALGGLLLAGAAIVFATVGESGRFVLLLLLTVTALALPVVLARRELTATAETLAAVALLLVLLDGYVAWSLRLFGPPPISQTFYYGLLCATTAAIAMAYRTVSRLIAPQLVAVLALQPVLPLLAYDWIDGAAGWALVFAGVATLDLAIGIGAATRAGTVAGAAGRGTAPPTGRRLAGRSPGGPDPAEDDPDAALSPLPAWTRAPVLVQELAWVLYGAAFGAALGYGAAALARPTDLAGTLGAASIVLLTAAVGVAGGVALHRRPVRDVATGLATLALIAAVGRVGAVALPGYVPLVAAGAVAIAALGVAVLPAGSRRGPRLAGGLTGAGIAMVVLIEAAPAIMAPLTAALPAWHADLAGYRHNLAAAAGPNGWQLVVASALLTVAAVVALPAWPRVNAVLVGTLITTLTAPAALRLSWIATPVAVVLAAVGFGVAAALARLEHTARGWLFAAAGVGCYAAAASLTRPAATALTLAALAVAGAVLAAPRPPRSDPFAEAAAQTVADAAAGGASFALPGAVASAAAALITAHVLAGGTAQVLAATFLATAATLGFAAVTLVARRRGSPPLLLGTTAGATAVAIAALVAPGAAIVDMLLGLLLLAGALAMWLAPRMGGRQLFGQAMTGTDLAAAVVTAGIIAAVARAVSLALPGFGLATIAALVLLLAIAVNTLPVPWRRGPVAGGALVGTGVAVVTGAAALVNSIGVIRAASPVWAADIHQRWWDTASRYSEFGWQAPVSLLLLAIAAAIALPATLRDAGWAGAVALAALGAPVGFGLPWWSPMVIGVVTAFGLGLSAAVARLPRAGYVRGVMAGVVGLHAAGASLVSPGTTAATTAALAIAATGVAGLATAMAALRAGADPLTVVHLNTVGGVAAGSAVLALATAAAAAAAGLGNSADIVLSTVLAAISVSLACAGIMCWRSPGLLAYVTAAVAVASLVVTLASIPSKLPTGLYAAAAALFGVLAELLRSNAKRRVGWRPSDGWRPARGWRPDRTWLPARAWRPASPAGGFGMGIALASGVPAAIAVLVVGPALLAALIGPYRWVPHIWQGTAQTASSLGPFDQFRGTGTDVLAAAALTLAAALAAIGLGGEGDLAASRATAAVIPGAALTMLVAPAALNAPWPAAPTAALLVATLAGLGLALTEPAPDTEAGAPLRTARQAIFLIALAAAGAGMAGSLATRSQTLAALAGSVVVGAIGALGGRSWLARSIGWQVAAGASIGLALVGGLAVGLPLRLCAFPVLAVAALLLAFAGALPRLRPSDTVARECLVLEAAGYTGAALAVGLTFGSARYAAVICVALGAVLGLAAILPGRGDGYRRTLVIVAAISELVGIWLLLTMRKVGLPEAYTLPFAAVALLIGLLELRRHPELGSWLAYGPALVAAFVPTLVLVLSSDSSPPRRVLVIAGAVITVAVGAVRRQKAPVVIGGVATAVASVHELFLLGRLLPGWVLPVLFSAAGLLLVALGATYEKRRHDVARLRGALGRMR
jgi:hypothetical protein